MKKLSFLSVLVLTLAACSQQANDTNQNDETTATESSTDSVLDVYTTAYPLTYFTDRIGGERINVQSIYPPGTNEHTFEPSQQDMIALAEADFLFYIGLGLEGFIDSAEDTLSGEDVKLVATSNVISDEELETGELHEEETDEEEVSDDEHSDEASEDEHSDETSEEESHDEHGHDSVDPHVWISPVLSQKLAE